MEQLKFYLSQKIHQIENNLSGGNHPNLEQLTGFISSISTDITTRVHNAPNRVKDIIAGTIFLFILNFRDT